MLAFVGFEQRDSSRQRVWDVSANVTGGLFELPGGFGARQRHLAELSCTLLQKLHLTVKFCCYSLPTLPVAYGAQKPVHLTGFVHKAAAEFQSSTLRLCSKYRQRR